MFRSETLVSTPGGEVPAGDLEPGGEIAAYRGGAGPAFVRVIAIGARTVRERSVTVRTESGWSQDLSPDHRTYAAYRATTRYLDLYLARREGGGAFVGLAQGQFRDLSSSRFLYETVAEGHEAVSERLWLLGSHRSLDEAQFAEHLTSVRYGLPILDFDPKLRGLDLDWQLVPRLLEELETHWRHLKLLEETFLDPGFAHVERKLLPRSELDGRRFVDVCYFWHSGNPAASSQRHRVMTVPFTESIRLHGERVTYLGSEQPLVELLAGPDQVEARIRELKAVPGTDVCVKLVLPGLKPQLFELPASYLRPGMFLPLREGDRFVLDEIREVRIGPPRTVEVREIGLETPGPVLAQGVLVGGP